jgi:inositol-1,4,5-trisphosphate 5-phosphatase
LFQALGNLYFAKNSINNIKIWNFLTHEFEAVEGKTIHTGNIETVATKEKAKFPQHFFPEVSFLSIYVLLYQYMRKSWRVS